MKNTKSDFKTKINKRLIKIVKAFSTPTRKIFLWYLFIFMLGALFLWFPISHNVGYKNISFIDAMFTSASAFSDTGLNAFNSTWEIFNFFGQFIIFILIILGGLGLFTLKIFILSFFVKKFSYRNYDLVHNEMEGKSRSDSLKMVKVSFFVSIFSILLFGTMMGMIFYFSQGTPIEGEAFNNPQDKFFLSFWMGFFTAASSINNAGFDITSSTSFSAYSAVISLQIIILFLFILGGIGFPLIYELIELIKAKYHGKRYKISLISKVLMFSYIFVAFSGLFLVFIIEGLVSINNEASFFRTDELNMSSVQRIWALIFNTFSTRSAGFSTFDLNYLSNSTLLIFIVLMFIGAGSSSTTGGIRTTTFWLILIFLISSIKGRKDVEMFKRKIKTERVKQAFTIFLFSFVLIFFSIILMSIINQISHDNLEELNMFTILFTATSAFGAVGLSLTSIEKFDSGSKLILIILMFVGQLGIANTLKQFSSNKKSKHYIQEDLVLG